MPVIKYIARQLFTYPFVVKVWDKVGVQEAKQFWINQRPPLTKTNATHSQTS